MINFTPTLALTVLASLITTLFIMKFFAHVLQTRTTNLTACFMCVLCTSFIMGCAIHFIPNTSLPAEQIQFLFAVVISTFVYNAFLNASFIKSLFLATANFMVQVLTLLGFSFAVNLAQAQAMMQSSLFQ